MYLDLDEIWEYTKAQKHP